MTKKEAQERLKINKLLEQAGWRLTDNDNGQANIVLESDTRICQEKVDDHEILAARGKR